MLNSFDCLIQYFVESFRVIDGIIGNRGRFGHVSGGVNGNVIFGRVVERDLIRREDEMNASNPGAFNIHTVLFAFRPAVRLPLGLCGLRFVEAVGFEDLVKRHERSIVKNVDKNY